MKTAPAHIVEAYKEIFREELSDGVYLKIKAAEYGDRWLVVKSRFSRVIGEPLIDGWFCHYFNERGEYMYSVPHSFNDAANSIKAIKAVL